MERHSVEIFNLINDLIKEGKEFALATIIKASAGSPGRTGFKMVVYKDGTTFGTVGGGELEFQTVRNSVDVIDKKKSKTLEYKLTEDLKMACGGRVELFIEYFSPLKKAWLFGGGHMAQALTPMLNSIGFSVNIIDNREDFAVKERFNGVSEVVKGDYLDFAEKFNPSIDDSVIIFTHGHTYDYDILNILCKRSIDIKYLGVIVAKNKIKIIKDKIRDFAYEGNLIDNVYAPIGLNIARRTTSEISVAIVAEIIAIYNDVKEIKFMSKK
jgi:xanthine dehydrogenase accessory factor